MGERLAEIGFLLIYYHFIRSDKGQVFSQVSIVCSPRGAIGRAPQSVGANAVARPKIGAFYHSRSGYYRLDATNLTSL